MALLIVFIASVALMSKCASALHDDQSPPAESKPSDPSARDGAWFDALLFLLVLVGTLRRHKSKRDDSDDCSL